MARVSSAGNGNPGLATDQITTNSADGSQPTAQQPATPQPARDHAGGHADESWMHMLPDLATLGFILASGNALKVWVALLIHALVYGSVAAEDDGPPPPSAATPTPTKPTATKSAKPKPTKSKPSKPKVAKKAKPTTKPKPKAKAKMVARPQHEAAARDVQMEAEWDNGSLSRATNLKNTAVHAAQNELVILGWLTKRPTRNSQGQFGGFIYILHKPPSDLPDAAKKKYETKLNDLFGRAYDLQHLLESTKVETVGGDCPTYADLFALASGKLAEGDGKAMVVEGHLRGCADCQERYKDILVTEQEWGE